ELAGRMRVHRDAAPQFGFAPVGSPELRQGQKETLLRREAVDALSFGWIFRQRALQRFIGDARATEVSDVFAERQLAVDSQTGQRFVTAILIDYFLRATIE